MGSDLLCQVRSLASGVGDPLGCAIRSNPGPHRCNVNLGTQWFDEDVENVVNYLDQSFYKFK